MSQKWFTGTLSAFLLLQLTMQQQCTPTMLSIAAPTGAAYSTPAAAVLQAMLLSTATLHDHARCTAAARGQSEPAGILI
jgi:hypothetical protein